MSTSPFRLFPKADTDRLVAQFAKIVKAAEEVHVQMHRAGIALGYRKHRPMRAHRQRCQFCTPRSNPMPLAIDGHAYARRRKNRRKS